MEHNTDPINQLKSFIPYEMTPVDIVFAESARGDRMLDDAIATIVDHIAEHGLKISDLECRGHFPLTPLRLIYGGGQQTLCEIRSTYEGMVSEARLVLERAIPLDWQRVEYHVDWWEDTQQGTRPEVIAFFEERARRREELKIRDARDKWEIVISTGPEEWHFRRGDSAAQ